MIVCKKCGNENRDQDSFCSSCGAFLEWSGEKVVEPQKQPQSQAPQPPATAPPPPDERQGLVQRVKKAVGIEESKSPPQTVGSSSSSSSAVRPATGESPASSETERGRSASQDAGASVAPARPVSASPPGAGGQSAQPTDPAPDAQPHVATPQATPLPEPSARPPEAVAPGSPHRATAPQVEKPTAERQEEDDVICGLCGTRNSRNRNFCRRCGASLLQAVVQEPKKRPWWRRYLSTERKLAAGERPARRGGVRRILGRATRITAIMVIAAVLASIVLTYSLTPTVRSGVNRRVHDTYVAAQRRFNIGSPVAVRPVGIAASSSALGRPPSDLIDLVPDDYWAADLGLDPQPELRISFGTSTDLDDMVITSGAGNDFARVGRPKDVLIIYSDRSQERLTLLDEPKPHKYELHANRTTSLTMRIKSVYPAEQSTVVAMSEIEFFRLQSPVPIGA